MPRKRRKTSAKGIYHVMVRGVNKQQIFYDDQDSQVFINCLIACKKRFNSKIYAYCLMGNHVHLLINEGDEPISTVMHWLDGSYAVWYNQKYERKGHLYQGRFLSVTADTRSAFLQILRYILQNPVKAGLTRNLATYKYSSGAEYMYGKRGISDLDDPLKLMDIKSWRTYLSQETEEKQHYFLEPEGQPSRKCTDTEAKELILKEFGTYTPCVGENLTKEELMEKLILLRETGISIRQLIRITGISKRVIERARPATSDIVL